MRKKEWVGLKFDMLTIVEELSKLKFRCICDCGNEKIVYRSTLSNKFRKTCGCHHKRLVVGERYGDLTIIEDFVEKKIKSRKNVAKIYKAKCKCGVIKEVELHNVLSGNIKTCGCSAAKRKGSRTMGNTDYSIFRVKNEESLYWAGFIAADGNIHNDYISIALKNSDLNHLNKIKSWMCAENKIYYKESTHSHTFSLKSATMSKDLKAYGIMPKKSLTYNPPKFCEKSRDFWRGMIDGDGCISGVKFPEIALCGTKETCEAFKRFVSKFCKSKANVNASKSIYSIRYSGKHAVKIMEKLYGNNPKFYLDRKYELANRFCNFDAAKNMEIMNKLIEACQTVVKGYEGDGMENMHERDHVFYRECKEALVSDWDRFPWAKYRTLDERGWLTYWENKPYEFAPGVWLDHTPGKVEIVEILRMEDKLDKRP